MGDIVFEDSAMPFFSETIIDGTPEAGAI